MLKDNQLSTILLLVFLGFLIYHLTKPKTVGECFTSESKETIANSEGDYFTDESKETMANSEGDYFTGESKETMANSEGDSFTGEYKETMANAEVKTAPAKPTTQVKPAVSKQVLAKPASPLSEKKPQSPIRSEISGNQMNVFQFEPNDINEMGAELESAFKSPIPQKDRIDVVDINKNNVKKYDAKDFLPKEIKSEWFDTDFSQAKFNLNDDKLINTDRYVIGVNTVGQSLKNASYDIRGTIPNPKFTVSPWNNSTYEPDFNLKSLC
jgi:hypothetical protein